MPQTHRTGGVVRIQSTASKHRKMYIFAFQAGLLCRPAQKDANTACSLKPQTHASCFMNIDPSTGRSAKSGTVMASNTNEHEHEPDAGRDEEDELPKLLSSMRIGSGDDPHLRGFDDILDLLRNGRASKVVILTGAGLSVAAGIPDFRSPGSGLYSRLQHLNLPRPESVFELDYFLERPHAFFELAKDLWPGRNAYRPTLGHHFIRLLSDKSVLLRNYTQNIDGLERLAPSGEQTC